MKTTKNILINGETFNINSSQVLIVTLKKVGRELIPYVKIAERSKL